MTSFSIGALRVGPKLVGALVDTARVLPAPHLRLLRRAPRHHPPVAEEPRRGGQRRRRRGPRLGHGHEHVGHEPAEPRGRAPGQSQNLAAEDPLPVLGDPVRRGHAREEDHEGDADGPDVRLGAVLLAGDNLGSGVKFRPDVTPKLRLVRAPGERGAAEIQEHDLRRDALVPVPPQHDVIGLYVAVNDADVVQKRRRAEELQRDGFEI
mmetsp:Transcript_6352/g.24544  ORF Transcript_6352/g.24544 Transcript_6352/m.24544 type:complete len:208 (-) Transcript_6352:1075-1698(-)